MCVRVYVWECVFACSSVYVYVSVWIFKPLFISKAKMLFIRKKILLIPD